MPRDDPVNEFRYECEAWNVCIQPEHPALPGHQSKQAEDGVRSAADLAGRRKELYCRDKILFGKARKAAGNLLVRTVNNLFARALLPVVNPRAAKRTIAIKHQERPFESTGHVGLDLNPEPLAIAAIAGTLLSSFRLRGLYEVEAVSVLPRSPRGRLVVVGSGSASP